MIPRASLWSTAAVVMWLVANTTALAAEPRALAPDARWRELLGRAETAFAAGDAREAERAWEESYRAVIRPGATAGMLALGHAYLRIGTAARDPQAAVARARQIFLRAFVQAREWRDAKVVADAGEAFAGLGDHEVADRIFAVAMDLAARNGDVQTRERTAALRQRSRSSVLRSTAER
jgi:hypothetical protein